MGGIFDGDKQNKRYPEVPSYSGYEEFELLSRREAEKLGLKQDLSISFNYNPILWFKVKGTDNIFQAHSEQFVDKKGNPYFVPHVVDGKISTPKTVVRECINGSDFSGPVNDDKKTKIAQYLKGLPEITQNNNPLVQDLNILDGQASQTEAVSYQAQALSSKIQESGYTLFDPRSLSFTSAR